MIEITKETNDKVSKYLKEYKCVYRVVWVDDSCSSVTINVI